MSISPRVFVLSLLTLSLTGCALGPIGTDPAATVSTPGVTFQGRVHGGQQPIVGSHIYLYAAGTGGYGGNGIAASTANASTSLLTSSVLTNSPGYSGQDASNNYYVVTKADGSFSITGDYTCTTGQQLYLYAIGGNPGSGVNSAAGLLAALGDCSTISSSLYIWMNEVSTVATAYAMAGFASDALHVSSSGTTLAQTGIANAFANATKLETLSTGVALATTPGGNGTVPQSTINTIANILAACINTSGPTTTGCTSLFNNILSSGATGNAATDTATAAIYLAQTPYPGTTQIANLFGSAATTGPFAPTLSTAPKAFTLSLVFTGGALDSPEGIAIDAAGNACVTNVPGNSITEFSAITGAPISGSAGYTGGGLDLPGFIAIDKAGNVWVTNGGNNSISEFSSTGAPISGTSGYTGGLDVPDDIAIDGAGNVWVTNGNNGNGNGDRISKFNGSTGAAISGTSGYTGVGLGSPVGIAIDGSGNAWVSDAGTNGIRKFTGGGVATPSSSDSYGGGLISPRRVAIDSSGNVWVANLNDLGSLSKFNGSTGAALSGSSGYTGGGLPGSFGIAIDGAGNVWVGDGGNLAKFNGSTGAAISSGYGYDIANLNPNYTTGVAVDGSGNVWATALNNSIVEVIGSAAPVITPICAGLPATPTANGSSNLGTRP